MSFRLRALIEDRDHEQFLRGLVDRLGRGASRTLRVEPYPSGRGAGEQHVRQKFPQFVAELRSQRFQEGLWGIVVIDGDVEGAPGRRRRLIESLETKLLPTERIVLLVPTRNVQTWGWCLLGHEVTETDDYTHEVEKASVSLRRLFGDHWPGAEAPPLAPPALREGWLEWARVA
jgi:hypothetical protein